VLSGAIVASEAASRQCQIAALKKLKQVDFCVIIDLRQGGIALP
jgi:hypothetical protein